MIMIYFGKKKLSQNEHVTEKLSHSSRSINACILQELEEEEEKKNRDTNG